MHEPIPQEVERLGSVVVHAGLQVHKALGAGMLESVYERCLVHELAKRGCSIKQQVMQSIVYDGYELDGALRLDLVVGEAIIVEVKSVEVIQPIHRSQIADIFEAFRASPRIPNEVQRPAFQRRRPSADRIAIFENLRAAWWLCGAADSLLVSRLAIPHIAGIG